MIWDLTDFQRWWNGSQMAGDGKELFYVASDGKAYVALHQPRAGT